MKGKSALLAGVAAIALLATAQAGYAAKKSSDATSVTPATAPAAAPAGPTNAELAARIQALEDALQSDESKASSDHTRLSTLEQNFDYAKWTFDNGRPVISSGDGRFSMAFRVRFQADFAGFMQDSPASLPAGATKDLASGAVIRRGFFGVEGKAFNDFWYEFRYNGGGTDAEGFGMSIARVNYNGIPNFRLSAGVIEPVFMLEGTTSSGQLMFLERPEIDNIAADVFGAGDSRRGVELTYQKAGVFKSDDNLVLSVAFTGNTTGTGTDHATGTDEKTQLLGRASYRFWNDGVSNASIGASGATIISQGGNSTTGFVNLQDRPEIRVSPTRLISTGGLNARHASMYAFDAAANIENFYLGGEYTNFQVDRLANGAQAGDSPSFSGFYVEGSWVLTGEPKTYTVSSQNNEVGGFGAPKVANPFSLSGESWGAWELVARYSDTNLNWNKNLAATATSQSGINGGDERIVDLGLNWYLNNNVKLQVHDLIVNVKRQSGVAGTQIGQDLNIVGIRLQFTN
ncbi:phosphate-selective porin OprO/OprP [Rhizomicrobium palustre]|uniref:Phosphate-selective porin OprO/OprP n=1 Tax=Rhizomicrobium palustre TaxID=189966 RepID=A0A846N3B4_9PROT|nr:porin [Rhizomicrobium palustre]NIK89761.1 phosphate-selective porin OprO/OprP [Rhizomicrobium palustre]